MYANGLKALTSDLISSQHAADLLALTISVLHDLR
jgi:hypothetical protein